MITSNHLHIIKPKAISKSVQTKDTYSIFSVSPLLIDNDDVVTVYFNSTNPSSSDWIGAYSPPDVDIQSTAPIKYGMCSTKNNDVYLDSGEGKLYFNMTNIRAGIKFYYFTNGLEEPVAVANSSEIVNFKNINEPLKNRVIATRDTNMFNLLWSSANSTTPSLKWGVESSNYIYQFNASTTVLTKDSLCGSPAIDEGWRDLGLIHTANFTGVADLNLNGKVIYYTFGDIATNDFSPEFTFFVPPLPGTQPPNRPTQVVLFADLGVGSTDSSYDTIVWEESCPPAVNTSNSIGNLALNGELDAVFLSGDLSYANGYLSNWDFFLDSLSPYAGRVVTLTTVGNHESDWDNSASLDYGNASGGECGVCALQLMPMPQPATTNEPWWSYDIGLIHFVAMSTEHNYTIGSPQYNFLEQDLMNTNRNITPWIIFSGHRSMYVDSDFCCENYDDFDCSVCQPGSDVEVMNSLQANIEDLLYRYRVNLAFSGHFHNVERQSATYQNKVVQASVTRYDSSGNPYAYHDNPNATVWMIIGSAGNGPTFSTMNYTWSERYWNNLFGYAIVTAVNATYLQWKFIDSSTEEVKDHMVITQDFTAWDANSGTTSSDDDKSGWGGLSEAEQGGIIAAGCILGVFILIVISLKLVTVLKCRSKEEQPLVKHSNEMAMV